MSTPDPRLDLHFPARHRVPARGWINDPNGIHKNGDTWHLFFQWNPHSARHARIHWGHATSTDLVHWREHPAALAPRAGEADADGCWSGVGLMDSGANGGARAEGADGNVGTDRAVPTLVYSAVSGDDLQLAQVVIARGDTDGLTYGDHRVVVPIPDIPGLTGLRDPFLLTVDGHRFGIQGAGIRREDGTHDAVILAWLADDLTDWRYLGEVASSSDAGLADMRTSTLWECPQLVLMDGRWVLIVGLWNGENEGTDQPVLQGSGYAVGSLRIDRDARGEVSGLRFIDVSAHGLVDAGPDFYAPQAVVDGDRVLLWGWSWEGAGRTQEQVDAAGWAGCLTLPRELHLESTSPESPTLISRFPAEVRAQAEAAGIRDFPDGAVVSVRDADGTDTVLHRMEGPGTIAIDASIVEILPEHDAPRTLRAYGTITARPLWA